LKFNARQTPEQIRQTQGPAALDLRPVNNADIRHQITQGLRHPSGGDHGFFELRLGKRWKRCKSSQRESGHAKRHKCTRRHGKNTSFHNGKKQQKMPSPSSPTVHERQGCTQACNHLVGRYPGWWNNLPSLPKRVFKTLSGCDGG
jgi:hypothetical protein